MDPTHLIGVPLTDAQKRALLDEARALTREVMRKLNELAEEGGGDDGGGDAPGNSEPA
jgi:hypothetical protein